MGTVIRPSLERAVESIFAQDIAGRVQILVGVDKPLGGWPLLEQLWRRAPPHRALSVLYPGYSTSVRHGGIYPALDGGCLRTVLTLLANACHVAYWMTTTGGRRTISRPLLTAVRDSSLPTLSAGLSTTSRRADLCRSVALDGVRASVLPGMDRGFCDPNTLVIDKRACFSLLSSWSLGPGDMADRVFFRALRENFQGRGTHRATCYYTIRRTNVLWRHITADSARPGRAPRSHDFSVVRGGRL